MKPPTSVTIQTPVLANRPVPSSHRNARLRSGAKSSLTGPQNSRGAARVNSHVIAPHSRRYKRPAGSVAVVTGHYMKSYSVVAQATDSAGNLGTSPTVTFTYTPQPTVTAS
jgi:hypothetical protein